MRRLVSRTGYVATFRQLRTPSRHFTPAEIGAGLVASATWTGICRIWQVSTETERDGYVAILRSDPKRHDVWTSLARGIPEGSNVTVDHISFTQRQCLEKALKLNRDYAAAWTAIAETMSPDETITINGIIYTQMQCYAEALRSNSIQAPTSSPVKKSVLSKRVIRVLCWIILVYPLARCTHLEFKNGSSTVESTRRCDETVTINGYVF